METRRPNRKFSIKTEAGIASAYQTGLEVASICERFGCSRDTVYTVIKSYNIPTRVKHVKNSIRRKR